MEFWRNHPLWLEWLLLREKLPLIILSPDKQFWRQATLLQLKYRILPLLNPKNWLY